MAILKQKSSFGPGKYRGIDFSKEKLQQFVDGTNKAIAAGIPIPLLKSHAPIGADDNATLDYSKMNGAGWLTKLSLDQSGAIEWEAKDVPSDVHELASKGTIRYTSPEFRNSYTSEKEGVYSGPIIRHIAITPLPGNPHQGEIETVALSEQGVFQFSELDREEITPFDIQQFGSRDNFYIYTDSEGKLPQLRDKPWESKTHKHWVKYRGNKPVAANPHPGQDKVWDYSSNKYVPTPTSSQHAEEDIGSNARPDHPMGKTGVPFKKGYAIGRFLGDEKDYEDFKGLVKKHGGEDTGYAGHFYLPEGKQIKVNDDKKYGGSVTWNNKGMHLQYAEEEQEVEDGPGSNVRPDDPAEVTEVVAPPINPDMPPQMADMGKLQAIIAGLNQGANVVLPSDWNPAVDLGRAMDTLLTALNTAIKAKQEAEMEKAAEQQEMTASSVVEAPMPYSEQFMEECDKEIEQFAHREAADEDLARELHLVDQHNVTNRGNSRNPEEQSETQLHNHRTAIQGNLAKKHKKGDYDSEKAKKLWGYYAKNLSDHYKKHYGVGANPATRSHLAGLLEEHYRPGESQHSEDERGKKFKDLNVGDHFEFDHSDLPEHLRSSLYSHGKTFQKTGGRTYFHSKQEDQDAAQSKSDKLADIYGYKKKPVSHFKVGTHNVKVKPIDTQHSEEAELAALPEKYRNIIIQSKANEAKAQAEAKQFQERERVAKVELARTNAANSLRGINLPPILRTKLQAQFKEIQFSEDGSEPKLFTISQVAKLVSETLPPNLVFPGNDITVAPSPNGQQFFEQGGSKISPEEAKALVDANPMFNGSRFGMTQPYKAPVTLQQHSAKQNADHPQQPITVNKW